MTVRQMTYVINVNLHLELTMVVQEMVEIGDDNGKSLGVKEDDNRDNECNLDIWQNVNCFTILNGGRLFDECTT
jgi:hypothetical protein